MLTEEQVRQAIADAGIEADPATIPADARLTDHGLDSLDIFNLLIEIQGITDREVPDEDVDKLESIRAIVDYFSASA